MIKKLLFSLALSTAAFASETTALIDLYNDTNGTNWKKDTNWTMGDPCANHWHGVTCEEGTVISLNLYDNKLSGTIPTSIDNLSGLVNFDLADNQLSGSIPSSLGNLSNLRNLDLGNNQLSGTIPSSLGNLAQLTYFYLHNNKLSGDLPSEILKLTSETDLQHNSLSNTSADASNITKWLNAHQEHGSLEGGSEAFYNTQTIKTTQKETTALTNFYLATNGENWKNHTNWTEGDPCTNHWYGVTCARGHIMNLSLRNNQLSGPIPHSLADLGYLTNLNLEGNLLSGSIPLFLGDLGYLTNLNLKGNLLSGNLPSFLGDLSNLTYLWLSNNQLSGDLPSEILKLTCKTDLRYNSLSNTSADASNITKWLNAHQEHGSTRSGSNAFYYTQTIKTTQRETTALINFYHAANGENWEYHANWIKGDPCTNRWHGVTCNNGHITSLGLYNNALSGTIHPDIGNLNHLTSLSLGQNQLKGNLDPQIIAISKIRYLDMSGNLLGNNNDSSGAIASWLDAHYHGGSAGFLSGQTLVAPTNLTFSNTTATSVTLHWSDNSNNESGFKIFVGDSTTPINTTGVDADSYTVTGLRANTSYTFTVKATND